MRKYLLLSFLLIWSFQVFATTSVRLRTDIDLAVTGSIAGTAIPMNVDSPSGDATSETAAAKLYFPIQNNINSTHLYFITRVASVFNVDISTHVSSIPLRVNADGGSTYLWAAVKDTSASNVWRPIKTYGVVPASQQSDIPFSFAPYDICHNVTALCSTTLEPGLSTENEQIFTVYFFLSGQSAYGATDTIDPTTGPLNNGIYFQMYMSNRTYTYGDLGITIGTVRVGDSKLTLPYTASNTLSASTAKSVRVFNHGGPAVAVNLPLASYTTGALTSTEYPYQQESEVVVGNLVNDEDYTLSILFVDKYNFGTTLSSDITARPLKIDELLKKNQCYLLTAGFGEDHYVISYFRHFRDTILVNSFLGRKFIHFYYGTAPKYAVMIYSHESIRAAIRGAAYVLYFVFNYIYVLLFAGVSACLFVLYRKNAKRAKAS